MIAGFAAGPCQQDRYVGAKKLQYCNISLTLGSWIQVFAIERQRSAVLYLEKGIALVELGRFPEAQMAFETAVEKLGTKQSIYRAELFQRVRALNDEDITRLYVAALRQSD
ncbi:MAG: hypothetical protein AAGD04_13035 [Pseudomonadota bacterium]